MLREALLVHGSLLALKLFVHSVCPAKAQGNAVQVLLQLAGLSSLLGTGAQAGLDDLPQLAFCTGGIAPHVSWELQLQASQGGLCDMREAHAAAASLQHTAGTMPA